MITVAFIVFFIGLLCVVLAFAFFFDGGNSSGAPFGFIPLLVGILFFVMVFANGGLLDDAYKEYVYQTPEFVNKKTGERSIPDSAAIFYLIDSQWVKIESYKAEKK